MNASIFPKHAIGILVSPTESWQVFAGQLRLKNAVALQLIVGLLCLVALAARAKLLADSNPHFAAGGISAMITISLLAQLLAYYLYILIGAWIAHSLGRVANPSCSYRTVLAAFSYASLPLLMGWALQALLAWLRSPPDIAGIANLHGFIAAILASISLQADLSPLLLMTNRLANAVLRAIGVFWVWHFVSLWTGLRLSLGYSRRSLIAITAFLFVVVVLAQLIGLSISESWQTLVNWKD